MISRLFNSLIWRIRKLYNGMFYISSKGYKRHFDVEFTLSSIRKNFASLDQQYMFFHHLFWHGSPEWLQKHRLYFKSDQRGFGEDAFHAMWYELIKEYKPKNMLEIGVYRGQVISLWTLITKELNIKCEIHGISPFTSAGDEVSTYISSIDYYEDIVKNFKYFSLNLSNLHRGFSTDPKMIEVINSQKWDLIYIDGSHNYDVVKSDFDNCSLMLSLGGIIVLDDSALFTDFKPPAYSSAGHAGPSRLANEIDLDVFSEILSVGHNRVFKKISNSN